MVVESRIQMKAKGLSKHSVEGTDGSFIVSEVGDVTSPDYNSLPTHCYHCIPQYVTARRCWCLPGARQQAE